MTETKRLRIILITLVAFAVLLVTALFSVSYAKWSGTSATATADGSVGKFYVEYPSTGAGTPNGGGSDVFLYGTFNGTESWSDNSLYRFTQVEPDNEATYPYQFELETELKSTDIFKVHENGYGYGDLPDWYNIEYEGAVGAAYSDKNVAQDGRYLIILRRGGTRNSKTKITVSPVIGDKIVRNAKMSQSADGSFKYHNYICVSREASQSSDSIAFIEFAVSADDLSVPVKSITIKRLNVDSDGSPTTGNIDPAPRLYGLENVAKLSDINHQVKSGSSANHGVTQYYEDGLYCILFFSAGVNQYYALDITIETESEANNLTLTATASNTNHWQRYAWGYGEPWGYYLGGLINKVWLWEPRRTTKMNSAIKAEDVEYDTTTINSKTVTYPTKVDLSLSVNLTEGSLFKLYMLDETGNRLGGESVYILPKQIIASDGLFGASDTYYNTDASVSTVREINHRIPKSGSYTIRYVGNVSVKKDTTSTNDFINVKTGKFEHGTPAAHTEANGWYYVPSSNFLVDTMYIIMGSSEHTVTFMNEDGTVTLGTKKGNFGGTVTSPDAGTKEGYTFDGWYFKNDSGAYTDKWDGVVTGDITVYAKWKAKEEKVTFKFVSPGWSGINSVKITAIGSKDSYGQISMNGTDPNYTHTFNIDSSKGNIIGVKIQFNQTESTWTAYSSNGYAEYKAGETYTLTYSAWDNPDWDNNRATFNMTVKDSNDNSVTTTSYNVINVKFNSGVATLTIRYNTVNASKKGIHYFDCTSPSGSPQFVWGVDVINDTDDSCSFILTKQVGWNGDTNQSNDITCTWSSDTTKTYTIYAKSGGSVIAYVDVVGATLTGSGVA